MNMEAWDEEEEEMDNSQYFQVNVVILEARHLSMINSDCKVEVTIGNRRKTVRSKTARTDAPYFNEFCIFNFYQPLSVFLDEILEVKIYGISKFRKNRLIGGFTVELSTVWLEPNHQFYHKWAALTDAQNLASGVKGYLKCDIGILAQGMKRTHAELDQAAAIEDHLLVPHGEVNDRQRARFIFSLFRADNFSDLATAQPLGSLYAYVKITYAGKSGRTSVANNTFEPLWNEELTFDDMVPALCQYVHIELCDAHKTTASRILGTANLDLRQLSHESEKGFLPTYGPSFLYLYQNYNKTDRRNKCPYVNYSYTYICRLLMALRTEIVDYAEDVLVKKPNLAIKPKSIPSIIEGKYFHYREFIFFAAVFDILLFDSSIISSKVSVRVNIGPGTQVSDQRNLKSTESLRSSSRKDEDDDTGSTRSKKTVTFEGNDITDISVESSVLEESVKKAPVPRKEPRKQPFVRTLTNWPTKWPEDKKWGREMNERLQRKEITKFRKWKQERKRTLAEWPMEWKKKCRERTEDGIVPKKMELGGSTQTIHVNEISEKSSSVLSGFHNQSDRLENSDDNERTTNIQYDSSKDSGSGRDLARNKGFMNVLENKQSEDSSDTINVREEDKARQKSPMVRWRAITNWPKDFKRRSKTEKKQVVSPKTKPLTQKFREIGWKDAENALQPKRMFLFDLESFKKKQERTGSRKRGRLSRLQARLADWRWERERKSLSETETMDPLEMEGATKMAETATMEDIPGTAEREQSKKESGAQKEADEINIMEPAIRERDSEAASLSQKTTDEESRDFSSTGPSSSLITLTHRRYGSVRFDLDEPQEKPIKDISRKMAPPILKPYAVVPFSDDTNVTPTSDSKLSEMHDEDTSSDLVSLPYTTNSTATVSEKSIWSQKTIWPREIPPSEDWEPSIGPLSERGQVESKILVEEPEVRRSFSELSEEIGRTDYYDYDSVSYSAESVQPEIKVVYKNLEVEEEEEEGQEQKEKKDLSEPSQESDDESGSKETKEGKTKEEDLKEEMDVTEKETEEEPWNEAGNLVHEEKDPEDTTESAKTKKYWYRYINNNGKIYSPDNTTEKNAQIYLALTRRQNPPVSSGKKRKSSVSKAQTVKDETNKKKIWQRKEKNDEGSVLELDLKTESLKMVDDGEGNEDGSKDTTLEDKESAEEIRHVRMYNGCNSTKPHTVSLKQHYGYAPFSGKYPCLHINGEWPNTLRRMYRSNVIQKSILHLSSGISDVANELSSENKIEASEKLKKLFSEVSADCREILSLTANIEPEDTNLYRERKRYYHREIGEIIAIMEEASRKKVLVAEEELSRAYGYLSTLKRYAQDPEDSFPDTEIWLIKDGNSIGQHKMHTRKVVFSPNVSERGVRAGKIQSVIVRGKDGEVVAKLEMFMWFGLENHFLECRKMLPSGYVHDDHKCPGTVIAGIPLFITYSEVHYFTCRVHLFQARIIVGADVSGLADPFVRVTVLDQQKETSIEKERLNPTWNECLVFPKLKVYGPADYVRVNSLSVIVEVWDYDYLSRNEFTGRTLLKPGVCLLREKYVPPKPTWEGLRRDCSETGKILLAAELLEVRENEVMDEKAYEKGVEIPKEIRPQYVGHRLEVLFWGVRELKKKGTGSLRVFVTLECGKKSLSSPVLKNAIKYPNFSGTVQTLRLSLPEEHEYKPPLIIKLFQTNAFATSQEAYSGNCMIPSVKVFFCETIDDEKRKQNELAFTEILRESKRMKHKHELEVEAEKKAKLRKYWWRRVELKILLIVDSVYIPFIKLFKLIKCKLKKSCTTVDTDQPAEREEYEGFDWWVKYYASKESNPEATDVERLVIYDEELEAQPEYHGFSDFIYTFDMVMGKVKNEVQSSILVGKVKAAIKLYRWPLEKGNSRTLFGADIRKGVLKQLPSNHSIKYVVRVYIVACRNLTPKDLYGKSDPYLYLQIGKQIISDQKNYKPKQVNPIFGKCFEFYGVFPYEHLLQIKVFDHDVVGDNDLIGETSIDLESRYYTKHHASCGISQIYATSGPSAWRDVVRPTELLSIVCKQSNMPAPVYTETGVRVGEYEFRAEATKEKYKNEVLALSALKKWQEVPLRGFRIVPEHVETRALYHPSFPGVEQGKIEMWVDIFPADFRYVPPIVDIKPREPVAMELRAIVWNVENVVLDDTTLFFNERMSDIYVQGWLNALEHDKQSTDVHYRSMNGEGNFNWRFVFPFMYVPSERRLVVYKKMNDFDVEPEEMKFPCRLELQVWDNDFVSDDFLGSLNLELSAMPRGAKISTRCKLSMFEDSMPKINLFKIRRTRGWWPFRRLVDPERSEYSLAGKIDLELEVVTEKEASENPVGKGREEPKALPEPKRPESSFLWALNPLKTIRYIICRKYGKHLCIFLLIAMLIAFVIIGIYAFPGYAVKRLLGA